MCMKQQEKDELIAAYDDVLKAITYADACRTMEGVVGATVLIKKADQKFREMVRVL